MKSSFFLNHEPAAAAETFFFHLFEIIIVFFYIICLQFQNAQVLPADFAKTHLLILDSQNEVCSEKINMYDVRDATFSSPFFLSWYYCYYNIATHADSTSEIF